jgi:integrase
VTVGAAHESWRDRWQIGKAWSTVKRKDGAWPHVQHLADVPLTALTPAALEDAIASAARYAPRQAQLALEMVKQVLRDARARGQRINPALLDVRAPRYEEREPVFLTAREVEDLASWSSEPRLIQFAAFTGLRLGELLALRDTEIDLDEGCVLVIRAARKGVEGRTKTRKKRRVYLCAAAMQALREQLLARRPTSTGLVFPSPRSDGVWNSDNFRADVVTKAVKRVSQKAGPGRQEDLARLEFHDLRHTFASLMIAAGANPLQIAEALGHSDKTGRPDPTLVWKRYGHLYPGSTREAMAALDQHLGLSAY